MSRVNVPPPGPSVSGAISLVTSTFERRFSCTSVRAATVKRSVAHFLTAASLRSWVASTWQPPFFLGLTLPVFLACAAERALNGSGCRVLLLAWPGYLLLWSLSALRPLLGL